MFLLNIYCLEFGDGQLTWSYTTTNMQVHHGGAGTTATGLRAGVRFFSVGVVVLISILSGIMDALSLHVSETFWHQPTWHVAEVVRVEWSWGRFLIQILPSRKRKENILWSMFWRVLWMSQHIMWYKITFSHIICYTTFLISLFVFMSYCV